MSLPRPARHWERRYLRMWFIPFVLLPQDEHIDSWVFPQLSPDCCHPPPHFTCYCDDPWNTLVRWHAFRQPPAGPPTAFPPSAPPVGGWTGESNGSGNGTAGQYGQHGTGSGQPGSYPAAPPKFGQQPQQQPPPPIAPPGHVGSNGVGLGPSQTYGGGIQTHGAVPGGGGGAPGMAMGPPGASSMYAPSRPPPSFPGAAPGQVSRFTSEGVFAAQDFFFFYSTDAADAAL